jgi:ABC-type multidrug transport system permease subunit
VNPVSYGVDLFRYSVTGRNTIPVGTDIILLLVLSAVVFFLATWLFDRKFRD